MKKLFLLATLMILGIAALWGCSSGEANSESDDEKTAQDTTQTSAKADSNKEEGRFGDKRADNAVPVEVTSLTEGAISSYLQYSSTLETEQIVDVFSRINGLVEAIYVEEGDRVYKNQKLLQIEKDEYELAEQKAKIEYQKQEADFNRLKALQAEELLSEKEFGNAELALKQSEIAWKQAALNLDHTTVTAPISGVIGERLVRLGDRIQTTSKLFTVANLDEKIVKIYVPQDEYTKCYIRQQAIISTEVISREKFAGFVKRISPIVDPQSGTFKVTVAVKDPQNRLRPGMFVNAELIVDTHEDTRLMPKSALIYENERTYFFTVENDTSRKVELQKGFEDAEKVEVLNPLPVGTKIVVLGQNGLKEGTRVKIIEEKTYVWQDQPDKISTVLRTLNSGKKG